MSDLPTTPPPSEPPPANDTTSRYPAGSPPPTGTPVPGAADQRPKADLGARIPALDLQVLAHSLAVPLLVTGLLIPLDSTMLLRATPAWAGLVLVAALLQIAPLLDLGSDTTQRWTIGAVGTSSLILFWVSAVQPGAGASTTGFFLTLGVALSAVGTFTSPHRRWPAIPKG